MPETAAFIDEMRRVFGKAEIDAVVRAGVAGEPGFHASENGLQVGTPIRFAQAFARDERGVIVEVPINGA